jgi:peroxiredoxin
MTTRTVRALQWTALVVLALVAGFAGLRFGAGLRSEHPAIVDAPKFAFKPGDRFPDVQLADSLGTQVGSVALVTALHGAVVLFLDPNCEGCSAMAARWERGVADGVIEPERVIGITTEASAVNAKYRADHGLNFPIYQDVATAFLNQHGVVSYPMELVVGPSGTINAVSDDSKSPIDGESIRALIAQ